MKASRPKMPKDYGVPNNKAGLLPWSHVAKRMAEAKHYWVCSVDEKGHPHATPVDGLWLDDALYFGGSPETRRHRNMMANPEICVHLDDAMNVIALRGAAKELKSPDRDLCGRLSEASKEKYGYGPKPEDYAKSEIWVFHPRVGLGWKEFPKDVTRWTP